MRVSRDAFLEAFRERGHELWTVGGALRDELLAIEGHDEDFATNALPDDIEAIGDALGAELITVGKKFGTVGFLLDGRWSEVTTFRGDSYEGGTRWPEVRFSSAIEDDLARRDFTINALARDVFSGRVLDLFGGEVDLRAGVIRAVGEPATRFREDPLRILRGVRFVAQLGFELDPPTLAGMQETAELTRTLSTERVGTEFDKLICGPHPGKGLEALRESGVLPVLFRELAAMVGCEQNHWHFFDVWGHTLSTVEAIKTDPAEREQHRLRRWTAMLHDLGKPPIRHMKPNGEWGFFSHETVGADMAKDFLSKWHVNRQTALVAQHLVRRHMDRPEAKDRRSVRRFMSRCEGHWRDLLALKRADNASHTYVDDPYHDALEAMCERVETEESEMLRAESPLNGNDLVTMFNREPGPWIRRIKLELSRRVLDGELQPGDRESAESVAKQLMHVEMQAKHK